MRRAQPHGLELEGAGMARHEQAAMRHYDLDRLKDTVFAALTKAHGDLDTLTVSDLAPLDGFHIRGRAATEELAQLATMRAGWRVLDVGCGLGGTARHLAARYGCSVSGLDLTPGYVDLAQSLSALTGSESSTTFHCGSAIAMPFDDDTFDCVWMEHVQMNIPDKARLAAEVARVLRPDGLLALHEVLAGEGEPPLLPAPWAEDESTSFLVTPSELRGALERAGLTVLEWRDVTAASRDWFQQMEQRMATHGPPALGIHLLMGPTFPLKVQNLARNLAEGRLAVIQAVLDKPAGRSA